MDSLEHVEKHPSGAAVCRHCGGEVGEDGYAAELLDGEAEEAREGEIGDTPEQGVATERMRDAAFADALKRRAR